MEGIHGPVKFALMETCILLTLHSQSSGQYVTFFHSNAKKLRMSDKCLSEQLKRQIARLL